MKFVKDGECMMINIETISYVEKDSYDGHWRVHLTGGETIKVKSEEFIKELEELCSESAKHRRSSTGYSCTDVMKLTESVFDRDDCPEWARYAAVDKDGVAYFFEREPHAGTAKWIPDDPEHKYSAIPVFDTGAWKNSLVKVPGLS